MNSLTENIIVNILEKTNDSKTIIDFSKTCRQFHTIVKKNYYFMIYNILIYNKIKLSLPFTMLKYAEIDFNVFLNIIDKFNNISNFKPKRKYQYLLNDIFNNNIISLQNSKNQVLHENATNCILILLINYINEHLLHSNVNLNAWAVYILLSYYHLCLTCKKKTIFNQDIYKSKILQLKREYKNIKNISSELKYYYWKLFTSLKI